MGDLAHYSPEDVTVLLGGIIELKGFVDGSFIDIRKDTPLFLTKETADGKVVRTHKKSDLYTVSINLTSYSDSNQALTYAALIDKATKMGKFPLIIKDQLGSSLFFALTAWIENMPDSSFAVDIESRQWVIKCADANFNIGGNYEASGALEDVLNSAGGFIAGMI